MEVSQDETYTIEDIYALPEGTRAELIGGHIYYIAPPNTRHQRILNYINTAIYNYIKSKKGDYEVFSAPFGVFLNKDTKYVEPDISVICDRDKLDDRGCNGAPDWIVEIVSPSSKRMDYFIKLFVYRTAGVREYWIVDPDKNRITIYNFVAEDVQDYTFTDIIYSIIYSDFAIDFSQLEI